MSEVMGWKETEAATDDKGDFTPVPNGEYSVTFLEMKYSDRNMQGEECDPSVRLSGRITGGTQNGRFAAKSYWFNREDAEKRTRSIQNLKKDILTMKGHIPAALDGIAVEELQREVCDGRVTVVKVQNKPKAGKPGEFWTNVYLNRLDEKVPMSPSKGFAPTTGVSADDIPF